MPHRPTITDVARHAGVSKGLVSLALNDRPGVAATTRRKILASVDQLGWTPSRPARELSLRTAFALGLVIRREPRVLAADPFFPAFIGGVESVLAEEGRTLVLSVVPDQAAEQQTYRRLVDERRVDGVFLTDLRVHDHRIALLRELDTAAVTIGRPAVDAPWPAVTLDDQLGIAAAVRHLAGLGHTRIGYVGGDVDMVHGLARRTAFCDSMALLGLDPVAVVDADFSPAAAAAATAALIEQTPRPTAIVYASDPMALAGFGVLAATGVRVPTDVSITGFDGSEVGAFLHPALSTVTTDPYGWGARAARVLLDHISTGASPESLELPPAAFVARGTTCPPPPLS